MSRDRAKIATVLVFANGMVAVCNEHGEQMPEYQGRWDDMREMIKRDLPTDAVVQYQSTSLTRI